MYPTKLKKLLDQSINEDTTFEVVNHTGLLADVAYRGGGAGLSPIVTRTLTEHADLIAHLLNKSHLLLDVVGAFVDLMDGNSWQDIRRQTGLDMQRCRQIYDLYSEIVVKEEL